MRTALITILILSATLLSSNIKAENTYPPENAAVLYYKNLDYYPPEGDIMNKIQKYAMGHIELDEDIVKHLDKYQYVIKELTVAGDIKICNWGIDFSEGMSTLLPGLSDFRKYSYLLVSDARRLVSNGDYYEAVNRCITAEKFAAHVSGNTLINSMVGTAISAISDKCITHILSETLADESKLLYLRGQLDSFDNRIKRMRTGLLAEKKLPESLYSEKSSRQSARKEILDIAEMELEKDDSKVKKEIIEKIKADDDKFLNDALKYHVERLDEAAAAFDLPYKDASEILSKTLPDKITNDANKKPVAFMAKALVPSCLRIYRLTVRSQNSLNAIKTALEVYLVKIKTGNLPKKLPVNTPKDLYTGKLMIYEITDEGFILRCQGPDTEKDKENDTYKFKVKK